MRWTLLLVLAGFMLPATATATANGPALLRLASCETGAATFEGDMRAVPGTTRMQMRFTLLARPATGGWRRVSAPRMDTWVSSDPGKLRYLYDKRVDGLVAPAGYRMRVRFRWLDAGDTVVGRAHRLSRVCRQRDLRPDLQLGAVRAADGGGYTVDVRNAGLSPAAAFDVALTVPGSEPVVERAGALEPGEGISLAFDAPPCDPGSVLQLVVDAYEEVDEAAEDDDAIALPCPVRG
jgi:hypothetical protein